MKIARTMRPRRVLAAGVGVSLLAFLAPTASALAGAIYCGGGYGPTAEVAVQSAIDDARNSASGDGLFNCTLAGEPLVAFVPNDPNRGDFFRASVNMSCS
jgi:hypothetical protein